MLRFLAFALLFATATPAHAQDSLEAEARANFEAGRIAFVDGRFADALPYFERAHELTGRAELLYNIGVCRDRIGHDVEALEAFEAYLAAIPDAANRSEVEQRIETARLRVARMAAGGEASEGGAGDDARGAASTGAASTGADPTGWILAAAGAAVAVAGGVLVGVGAADRAGIESSMGTLSWSDAAARASSADGLAIGGAVGIGAGVALAALGLGMALSVGDPEAPARAELSPTGVRVSW